MDDAVALRERLGAGRRLVVGAGFLGSEVASSARDPGAAVTLVEAAPVPLAHVLGHRAGEHLAHVHRAHGVDLRSGTGVAGIVAPGGRLTAARLCDGALVPADDVLVAIGSAPDTG
ncbi:FAD-dependent oxidoreductase [Streptomyces sp. NPDC092952]|uniref:FAD-dependent oxidoreductase n=1 Tax=Streptomyces sp. NPDC092952 TaxID=3366018 RepID=UPI0037F53CFA